MKKLIVSLLISIFSFSSFASDSKTFFRLDYGIGQFTSDKLDGLNANPQGPTYGIGFGSRFKYIELGAFYRKLSFEKEITHDSVANKIIHDGNTFGLDLSVFLNSHLGLKVGYAVNSYEQSFANAMSASAQASANSQYGIESDGHHSGLFYGVVFDFFAAKTWDMYASVLQFPMGDGNSTTSAQIGIRYQMNKSFADFFGD